MSLCKPTTKVSGDMRCDLQVVLLTLRRVVLEEEIRSSLLEDLTERIG